uniref:SJCHGC02571 protein n=1 Tax=Schistosoma japonicum TaxID=6182 RepID=Q5DD72_SCHJA|nr:SJCHGC02571 protein [Schistosoma japonicum]
MTDLSDNGLSGLSDDDANQNVKNRMSIHTNARRSTDFNRTPSNTEHHNHKHGGALQQLSSLLGQTMKLENVADLKGSLPTIPINDLRGEEAAAYHREDCVLRRSLAALYRLIDMRGWTHSIYNHISARCTTNPNQFLINPFGLLYHEIQASSLVKIDASGNIIDQGSSVLGVNKAGWTLHSALHSARKDVNCIIHVHLPDVIAVSCLRAGLLPVSPEAIELISNHGVRYHEYRGILVDEAEHASIVKDLGCKAKVLFLRNHGVAVAASNIPEAWYLVKRVITACQTQMRLMQLSDVTSLLSDLKDNGMQLTDGPADHSEEGESDTVDRNKNDHASLSNGKANSDSGDIPWTPAELEFEAEMRVLDSAGFRTGHVYRQPNLLRRTHLVQRGRAIRTVTNDRADLLTTDFFTNEFSGVEDIAVAEAAGAEQVARIMDHVRASRQKNVQRNQWLAKANEPSHNGIVTSSMIASLQDLSKTKCSADYRSHPFTPDSLMCSPVLRSEPERTSSQIGRDFHSSVTRSPPDVSDYSVHNGSVSTSLNTSPSNSLTPKKLFNDSSVNKSATLPANVQHMSVMSNSNTLQSVDGDLLNTNAEESRTLEKKIKKKGSFRMPSFSRKKKH